MVRAGRGSKWPATRRWWSGGCYTLDDGSVTRRQYRDRRGCQQRRRDLHWTNELRDRRVVSLDDVGAEGSVPLSTRDGGPRDNSEDRPHSLGPDASRGGVDGARLRRRT